MRAHDHDADRDENGFAEAGSEESRESGRAQGNELGVQLVRGVTRSWPWVLLLIGLGAALGLAFGLLQPNSYVSHAKLLLRIGAREQLSSESMVEFEGRRSGPPPSMADELQMLADRAIFERVARELGPEVVLQPADPRRGDDASTPLPVRALHSLQAAVFRRLSAFGAADAERDGDLDDDPDAHQSDESAAGVAASAPPADRRLLRAAKVLRTASTVDDEPGSSVILVSYTANSPELARTVVQALTHAFIERHRQHYSIQALLGRSRAQLARAQEARDEAAGAYVDQVSRSGMAVLETQVPRLETELIALEGELFAARMRREEIARLKTSLTNRLQGIPAEVELVRSTVMVPNEEYETQLTLKRTLLAQKQQMLIESRPSEETRRREVQFDKQIAKLDEQMAVTPRTIAQGAELHENLGHTAMEARIQDLEVEDEALPVKISMLEGRLETKRARLSELQKELLAATMLRKDLAAAREAEELRYTSLVDRLALLEDLQKIEAEGGSNLSLLQPATLEPEKIGPRRAGLMLRGLLAGTAAALAFALLRQRFERRLRHPETFEFARGVPVLGVVPHLSPLRRLRVDAPAGRS